MNTNLRLNFIPRWGPAILIMVLIFLFSSIPARGLPNFGTFDFFAKKGAHMIGYALLGSAYLHGLGRPQPRNRWFAWLLAVIYALTDEFHQSFVAGRGSWIGDVGIDAAGAFAGSWIMVKMQFYSPNSNSKSSPSSQDPAGSSSISPKS
jgi:VanZ family protein